MNTNDETIHICYCLNDLYFPQLLLSVLSVVEHTDRPLFLHIATMSLPDLDPRWTALRREKLAIIEEVIRAKNPLSRIATVDVTQKYVDIMGGGINENTFFSPYSMLRLLLDCYDFADRLIYLDTDTMCLRSIEALWDSDLCGREVGACYDIWRKALRPFYFWKPFYCNSGVLVFDMVKCRESGLFPKLRKRVCTKKMGFPDQTAISFLARKKALPRKFNELRYKIRKDTVIKHFVGFWKWHGPVCRLHIVKPTEVERVHKLMKIHEFDDVYEKYNRLAEKYGFAAL